MRVGRGCLRLARGRLAALVGRGGRLGLLGLVSGLELRAVRQLDDVDVGDALGLQTRVDACAVVGLQSQVILQPCTQKTRSD